MTRHALRIAMALSLTATLTPLAAQSPTDAPTYFATVLTPIGALPPLVMPAQLNTPWLGVGLNVLYGYGELSDAQRLPLHTVGAEVELALLKFLSVSGRGGYMIPDCGVAMHCDGYPMGGASAALRMARWTIDDPLTPGFVTLALRGEAGFGLPDGGKALAAAAGPSVAFVGTHGMSNTLRVVAFVTPQAVWGRLNVDNPAEFNRQFGSTFALGDTTFEKDGARFMIGGGLSVVSTHTGVGLHFSIQHVVVHGARPRIGVSVSLRST